MNTEGSIEIDRPIELVFQWTVDNVADWSEVVLEDELIEEHPDVVGSRFRTVTGTGSQGRLVFEGVITQFEPPFLHAIHMTSKTFDLDVNYEFEQLSANRTRVTQRSTVSFRGILRLIFKFIGGLASRASHEACMKELRRLKAFCERQEME